MIKKHFKKLISLALAAVMVIGIPVTAFAAKNEPDTVLVQEINEYDYVLALEQCTDGELIELGLTRTEADAIISNFDSALNGRAKLSYEELLSYGYSSDEIEILRSYSRGAKVSEKELRAITGTCTGNIVLTNCGTKYATFSYTWSWDHCPLMTLSDSAAMRWVAYDASGYDFSVIKTSTATNVDYYNGSTKVFSRTGTQEAGLEFNTVNVQFRMLQTYQSNTTLTEQAYAKKGSIKVSVQVNNGVSNSINYIMVAGLYGHTTAGANLPSVSLSPTGSVSISFSGNLSIDKIGGRQAKISTGSKITYL